MKIDLHMHSNISDGGLTPSAVVQLAHKKGIKVMALCDHDDIGGIKDAIECGLDLGVKVIPGVELSCANRSELQEFPNTLSIHILGYNIDYESEELNSILNTHRKSREIKTRNIVINLRQFGVFINHEDIPIRAINQMRIDDIIEYIQNEKVECVDYEGCINYLKNEAFFDLINYDFSLEEAINLIHKFGGKAVLAHPLLMYKDYKNYLPNISLREFNSLINYLCSLNIDGIEVYYLSFDFAQQEYLRSVAERNNLFMTIGSDFHGRIGRNSMIEKEYLEANKLIGEIIF